MTLAQIEHAVLHLNPKELAQFMRWMGEFMASQVAYDDWDRQIIADSNSGKLDFFLNETIEDIKAGRVADL